jgi:hypothetical protein
MLHLIQKSLRRSNRKMKSLDNHKNGSATDSVSADGSGDDDLKVEEPLFPQFSELNEDIQRIIVSFLTDAPYEFELAHSTRQYQFRPATLTTTLPLVNKTFYEFADQDSCWREALLRQLANEERDHIWKAGLRRMLPLAHSLEEDADLLQEVRTHLGPQSVSHKDIYRKIFTRHLKFEAPMFLMPCSVTLGEIYGLHLFEPRYRVMVRNLMDACEDPQAARNGEPIRPGTTQDGILQPPYLIHFCLPQHLRTGALACLIQVVWCRTYEQETADVQLMPIAWVKLDRVWCRQDQGDLFYAKATRV